MWIFLLLIAIVYGVECHKAVLHDLVYDIVQNVEICFVYFMS